MTPEERLQTNDFSLDVSYSILENLTPIMYAAKYGLINYLNTKLRGLSSLERSRILGSQNQGGLTPLHIAMLYKQLEVIKLFIEMDSPNLESNLGKYPVHLLLNDVTNFEGIQPIFEFISHYPDYLICENRQKETLAHLAAKKGIVPILEYFNSKFPDYLAKTNQDSLTPLMFAILERKLDAIEFLLTCQGIEITDSKGNNALNYALTTRDPKIIQCVLGYFNPNSLNREGESPLKQAEKMGIDLGSLTVNKTKNANSSEDKPPRPTF